MKDSIALIKHTIELNRGHKAFVLQSTGKDSMVVDDLCKKSGCIIQTVFNNTTLDCADTYKIVNSHRSDWIITTPEQGFYQYVVSENFIPTRFSRACCSLFKEGNHINYFKDTEKAIWIMGVRNDESNARKNRQDIEHNPKWGNKDWIGVLPIRKWTELDIWLYTIYYKLEVNSKYKKGYRRCGCHIACPYSSKTTWYLDKYFYPKMYNRWHNILQEDFIKHGKWCVLNCTLEEYHYNWNGGVVREQPTREVIQEFMDHQHIIDENVAKQYFNKTCCDCGKNIRNRDTIAMNLKFHGRNINKFYCKKCLKKQLNISGDEWNSHIKSFKLQGCTLF